jgi:hypothetical protein
MEVLVSCGLFALFLGVSFALFRRDKERVRVCFERVAKRRRGRVREVSAILNPALSVPIGEERAHVTCVHGSRGARSHTGTWLGCEAYEGRTLDVRRKPRRAGLLGRVGRSEARTGDRAFDEAFWLDDPDGLLDAPARAALLAFDERLRVSVQVGLALAFRDGQLRVGEHQTSLRVTIRVLPPEVDQVLALLDLTERLHRRLLGLARRRVA